MTNEIFSEILLQNGYAAENVRCIADLLSYGLVDKCLLAIQRGDKQMLFGLLFGFKQNSLCTL